MILLTAWQMSMPARRWYMNGSSSLHDCLRCSCTFLRRPLHFLFLSHFDRFIFALFPSSHKFKLQYIISSGGNTLNAIHAILLDMGWYWIWVVPLPQQKFNGHWTFQSSFSNLSNYIYIDSSCITFLPPFLSFFIVSSSSVSLQCRHPPPSLRSTLCLCESRFIALMRILSRSKVRILVWLTRQMIGNSILITVCDRFHHFSISKTSHSVTDGDARVCVRELWCVYVYVGFDVVAIFCV